MHLLGLLGVHLGGRCQDHGFQAGLFQAFGQIAGEMGNLVFPGYFLRRGLIAARERDHFDAGDFGDGVQVLDAEGALSGETDLHRGCFSSSGLYGPQKSSVTDFSTGVELSSLAILDPVSDWNLRVSAEFFVVLNLGASLRVAELTGPQFLRNLPLEMQPPRFARGGISWEF